MLICSLLIQFFETPIFQVGLQKQRRLLQTENLTLEAVVTMKSQRLSFMTDENRRLRELLRMRETTFFFWGGGVLFSDNPVAFLFIKHVGGFASVL